MRHRSAIQLVTRSVGRIVIAGGIAMAAGCGPDKPYQIPDARTEGACVRPADAPPFWWGISTSSFQVEGPDTGSSFATDWDLCHRIGRLEACRDDRIASLENMDRDIAALKWLGATHYRFSIEWARVEPAAGQADDAALEEYVELARRLRAAGIMPVVCLWHFTFPSWLSDMEHPERHGWLHPDAAASWERFVRRVATAMGPLVEIYAPQNEPNAYAFAVTFGIFPPRRKMPLAFYDQVIEREIAAFRAAAAIVRDVNPSAKILSVQNVVHWQRSPFDLLGVYLDWVHRYNDGHLDGVADVLDYVGFNYYQREVASPFAMSAQGRRGGELVSDLGWYIDPEGLEISIADLSKRYRKPIVITENGIADSTDRKRPTYLLRHLLAVRHALEAGYDVRGYFHWSLMDNFEWAEGYQPKFGLFAVDEKTKALEPKFSARMYRMYAKGGFMDVNQAEPMGSAASGRP